MAVSVGNENTPPWGAHMVPAQRLLGHARRLHAALNKPVTFCEGVFEWPALGELGRELDFISVHSYPYHYGDKLEEAVAINKRHLAQVRSLFPDKQVLFTEVGWSTNNDSDEVPKRASVENQRKYITELTQWLEQDQVIAFLFEAFDEPWKASSPEKSECNWGLYDLNRQKKW